ncbi:MAG: ROK family transcriptional regulator [Propioniciclava sp.]|uniref:ROK family transcriptional regulator n=1 Tax=Propioniciclava sp. TaxID=2038686 RepID=UPI0039E27CD8
MERGTRRTLRPEDARRSNRALVLQSLYDAPHQSRADLARATGLTKVTVSDLVAELIGDDLVVESGTSGASRPGKPSTMLTINPASRAILALDVSGPQRFRGVVVSPLGEVLATRERVLAGERGEDAVCAALDLARALADAAEQPILGLGVATPGTVAPDGTVQLAPNLGWRDTPLGATLSGALGFPVHVENDANASAQAEHRFGGFPGTLVRVRISRGVGAGLLIGGALVRGTAADAGEIGHVVVDPDGGPCGCGKTGCLETWTSVPALRARLAQAPEDREAVLADAGRRLGATLAPVVGMLGLEHLVIGGPSDLVAETLIGQTRDEIVRLTRSDFRPHLNVAASTLGEDAALLGAAALVLRGQLGVT